MLKMVMELLCLLVLLTTTQVWAAAGPALPALVFNETGFNQVVTSKQPAVVLFSWPDCELCSRLEPIWDQFSLALPAGTMWVADCAQTPEICARCETTRSLKPIIKTWTGNLFVVYQGDINPNAIVDWLKSYSDWDLDEPGHGIGLDFEPDNAASLIPGKLQPWTGQALPTQIFLPSTPLTGRAKETGLRPVIVYFHGGNDGPWVPMEQQALAYQLVTNETY